MAFGTRTWEIVIDEQKHIVEIPFKGVGNSELRMDGRLVEAWKPKGWGKCHTIKFTIAGKPAMLVSRNSWWYDSTGWDYDLYLDGEKVPWVK